MCIKKNKVATSTCVFIITYKLWFVLSVYAWLTDAPIPLLLLFCVLMCGGGKIPRFA